MAFDRTTSAGYLANHMARLFEQGLRRRIRPLGIVPGQFPALLALWERDGQTQSELLDLLAIEQATLANTLARMERDGLIVRREDARDARARTIHLTDRAKAVREAAEAAAIETNELALSGFAPSERRAFVGYMTRAIEALTETDGETDPG